MTAAIQRRHEQVESGFPPPRVYVRHGLIAAMRELYVEGDIETALFLAQLIATDLGVGEQAAAVPEAPDTEKELDVTESGPRPILRP